MLPASNPSSHARKTDSLTPVEARLLLLAARSQQTAANRARMTELASKPIDWDRLIAAATRNSVLPMFASALASVPTVPKQFQERMGEAKWASAMHGMRLTGQLAKILTTFRNADIRALPFKGPTLAALAYRNIALRPFDDVDVLVSPKDAVRAAHLLKGMGFEGWGISADREADHLRSECEETFIRRVPGGALVVDLHWALSRNYLALPVSFERLWERSMTTLVGGTDASTLGPEDLLQFLCLHGSKHQWERLVWICDVAELTRAMPDLNWDRVFREATENGSLRMLQLGLRLASDLLDAPLPPAVKRKVSRDRVAARLAQFVVTDVLRSSPEKGHALFSTVRTSLFHMWMRERLRDRFVYLVEAAAPNTRDRDAMPLPRSLHFLHYATRPLRLLNRYGLSRLTSSAS